ncbi:MAG: thioredoxin domain-containing protein [Crenarchaeota archaeon]|nr:thioredoxin domain-containing protein [Thermoproteota archaeon]HJJ22063.1 DsbA family protein [Nitrosopumilus sp.]MDA0854231.1 thioredoxin domain-containing protein [Thermoproteota archaeon]MDA1123178.1 thioredoxin domain-containing protein [Thermoproteota archaeon]HJJ24881.1 DsbA family protein [Nitrosopumilus sp.]
MKLYYLSIPVIIGVIAGGVFVGFQPDSNDSGLLTAQKLVENGSPVMGSVNAPITILEWGDYQCTFCYKFHQNTLEIINEDFIKTGKVKLIFKDFPLNGPDSELAAQASYCANDQDKYWKYHDELYKNWGGEKTGWITRDSLTKFAKTVDLDIEEFNKCLDDKKYENKVDTLYEFGKEIRVDATPYFLVFNDEKIIKIRGNQPLEVFIKSFEELN